MGTIVYGTKVKTKFAGYFGEAQECPVCHKSYARSYVRIRHWAHVDYIPLFPTKTFYFKACPICGCGTEMKKAEAKAEMTTPVSLNLEVYAKHILAKKPKGIMAADMSYELWVKDLATGEETCIETDVAKDTIKEAKKARGLKKLQIIEA